MSSFSRINRSALAELIVHRKTHIITMIFLGIAGVSYTNTKIRNWNSPEIYFMSLLFFFIALLPLMSLCVSAFKDMHDVPSADVQMAMPLSARERFFSKLMTVCYCWIFPYIFFYGAGGILSIITEHFSYYYDIDGRKIPGTYLPVPEMIFIHMKGFLWGLSIVLFVTASVALCASCIGSKAEAAYIPVILMIDVSVFPYAVYSFVQDKFADVTAYGYSRNFVSPPGFGVMFLDMDENINILYVLLSCVISVAMLAAAMYAYGKRDATSVGYPIVYRGFFEAVIFSSLILLFRLAHSGHGLSGIMFFIIFVGALVLRMVVSRKDITFMKVIKWSGIFAAYYALFLIFSYSACVTGGFGNNKVLPDTSQVSSACPVQLELTCRKMSYDEEINRYPFTINRIISLESAEKAAEIFAEYSDIQNKMPGYFTYSMYDADPDFENGLFLCSVYISGTSIEIEKMYSVTVYSSDIYLDSEKASALYDELNSLR